MLGVIMSEATEISTKNTKGEILDAYNSLLARVQATKHVSPVEGQRRIDEEVVVKKTKNTSGEQLSKQLMGLKVSLAQELDTLEQTIAQEYKKFADIQAAIEIESKNLQELYEIKKSTDTLAVLILSHKELKQKFEADMQQQRALLEMEIKEVKLRWKKEQEAFEQESHDKAEAIEKERVRAKEEYQYSLKIERKKDADAYESRKAALEKELEDKRIEFNRECAERETALKANEEEFKALQEQVKQFPHELEKTVKEAESATRISIETKYKHQIDLTTKEIEGERRLNQQIITSLQDKIVEQDSYIKQLVQKADASVHQVQSIAIKALEGTSAVRYASGYEDKKNTQATI